MDLKLKLLKARMKTTNSAYANLTPDEVLALLEGIAKMENNLANRVEEVEYRIRNGPTLTFDL